MQIEQQFQEKKKLAKAREKQMFSIFDQPLTDEETWALKYLYANMPISDLADYNGELFLNHVRTTLDIRKKVPWGNKIDDHLFLNYVLPYRVNTENIEDHRSQFYTELESRIQHLSMKEAILETNYWCFEKATYVGSDLRTISPLGIIKAARGRCGEESTLAVAALRSIGIPARQVYTPRWAHCDDNHAWVEAWADGKWYYLGACEPEPILNQGWFSAPARRAMLMNTRVFANYSGPEEILLKDKWFTEVNLLENYAPVRNVIVRIKDSEGNPVSDAKVMFLLINYSEFFPLATLVTNSHGETSFKTGYGELLVRAIKDGRYGEVKLDAQSLTPLEIVIDAESQPEGLQDFDLVPPPEIEGEFTGEVSEALQQQHQRRLEEGAAIRKRYEDSFISETQAQQLAEQLNLPQDRVWKVVSSSRGNWTEIVDFLVDMTPKYGEWSLKLLESLNEKDLIDTLCSTLVEHLVYALRMQGNLNDEIFTNYVLRPRISFEMLVPYRRYLLETFSDSEIRALQQQPHAVTQRIEREWKLIDNVPNLRGKGHVIGTYESKCGDKASLDILFVALCRTLGIPARLHPSEQKPQYLQDGVWMDASLLQNTIEASKITTGWGYIKLLHDPNSEPDAPIAAYYNNVTIGRMEGGVYKTLVLPFGKNDLYDEAIEAEPGEYRIVTGVRLKDGTVRVRFAYCIVREGETTEMILTFRSAVEELPVLGTCDMERSFSLSTLNQEKTIAEMSNGKAILLAWLEPDREPTKHLLRELGELVNEYNAQDIEVVLLAHDTQWANTLANSNAGLPVHTTIACDPDFAGLAHIMPTFRSNEAGYPHVFVMDASGQIRYRNSGYKPGTGKEALQVAVRAGNLK